jgi:hypothetical protein
MKSSSEPERFSLSWAMVFAFLILLTWYCGMLSGRSR